VIARDRVLAVMDGSEAVYLATAGAKGPVIRALVNLRRADLYPGPAKTARTTDFTGFLATSRSSTKVREIAANHLVSLYYAVPARFEGVTLTGTVRPREEESFRLALWHDSWRIYWPDGPGNPDYIVLEFIPEAVFGWCGSEPFTLDLFP
jgi:general stress protein 26